MAQIIDEADAPEVIKSLRLGGRYVVLHTGCFEILHVGHLACFTAAKQYEQPNKQTCLIVGVESDSTIRLNRSDKNRPLVTQEERVSVLSHINEVDFVIRFNPQKVADYADGTFFIQRLRLLSPDAYLISFNNGLTYLESLAQGQVAACAAAGVAILPVVHNVRTHSTDIINLLNKHSYALKADTKPVWLSEADKAAGLKRRVRSKSPKSS